MIPIRIEATNPSNIGSYKNTPNIPPKQPQRHNKPIKGSYANWIESKLTESKHSLLEDLNLTQNEVVSALISAIVQSPKYSHIAYWVDNEVDDGLTLESNLDQLNTVIVRVIIPALNKYYTLNADKEFNANDVCTICSSELSALNNKLAQRYGEVT